MSRQSLLPPRCPFQKQHVSRPLLEAYVQHNRSPSHGSILEEKPAWLDDLLSDEEADSKGTTCLRRSASDSVTLLDGIMDSFAGLNSYNDEEAPAGNETCSGLGSASVYGPNSPRRRGNVTFSENAIASALSEYAFQNPLQYVDGSLCISGITHLDSNGDACGSSGELNGETKIAKRHSGQRSRVRKLQYIAELERSVNVLQTVESELAVKVASMLQKRAALSMENSKLKQQMARLRQDKLIVEGQYKNLKKDVERLRNGLGNSANNKSRKYSRSSPPPDAARSEVTWQMLDMAKLNLI